MTNSTIKMAVKITMQLPAARGIILLPRSLILKAYRHPMYTIGVQIYRHSATFCIRRTTQNYAPYASTATPVIH